ATAGLDPAHALEVLAIADRPELLPRLSQGDPEHVRSTRADKVTHALVVLRGEVSMVPANNLDVRIKLPDGLDYGPVLLFLRAEDEEAQLVFARSLGRIMEKISGADALGQRVRGPAACKDHRHAICMDDIGRSHGICKRRILSGEGDALAIGGKHSLRDPVLPVFACSHAVPHHALRKLAAGNRGRREAADLHYGEVVVATVGGDINCHGSSGTRRRTVPVRPPGWSWWCSHSRGLCR